MRSLLALVLLPLAAGCGGARMTLTTREATVYLRKQPARPAPAPSTRSLFQTPEAYVAEYLFHDARAERVSVRLEIAKADLAKIDEDWGYDPAEISRIRAKHRTERERAKEDAEARRATQNEFDREMKEAVDEQKDDIKAYLESRGFMVRAGNVVVADIPVLARRSAPHLAGLAKQLKLVADQKRYEERELLDSMLALIQTGIVYEPVPGSQHGHRTGGVWPPSRTLAVAKGDCDTKAILLAALLSHFPGLKVVGVTLPGHYILGVLREPGPDESYMVFENRKYVLIEAAGPARLPLGHIGTDAEREFRAQASFHIEKIL